MENDRPEDPSHYKGALAECWDAIEHLCPGPDAHLGPALKYLWRWRQKGGIEDLKKASRYLDRARPLLITRAQKATHELLSRWLADAWGTGQ